MTTETEALVRRAYHLAEGDVLDVQGFIDLFAEDGVFNNVVGQESYRGEHLGDLVVWMGKLLPDVHRELHRVNVMGDVVAVELSIRGTFLGPFETPAGVIHPTGAKLDIPTADFWYVRDGKIQEFNCYVGVNIMLAQLGVMPDFASAVASPVPARQRRPTSGQGTQETVTEPTTGRSTAESGRQTVACVESRPGLRSGASDMRSRRAAPVWTFA